MQKIQFEDYPGTTTPVSADNLNQVQTNIEDAINEVSSQVPEVVNEESSSQTKCYSSNYTNNNFELKGNILWTNPDITQDFASQQITLSSSDYDILEFYYAFQPEMTQVFAEKTLKGSGVQLNTIINLSAGVSQANGVRQRQITYVNDTTYSIADCLERAVEGASVPTVRNDRIIPLYVVGYKTGLFNNV